MRLELETRVFDSSIGLSRKTFRSCSEAVEFSYIAFRAHPALTKPMPVQFRTLYHTAISIVIAVLVGREILLSQSFDSSQHHGSSAPNLKGAAWVPDNGDGSYTNPVIYADYSDPDVIRVGNDYYLTSSSFSQFPGLPILHSTDLVNWRIVGHAVRRYPVAAFDTPQHGDGIWAPSIRYHRGEFYIYFGDPDRGIYMTKAKNTAGSWDSLVLVRQAKGWIDPCPLWDEDGKVYLVHAWAKSRSGINSILTLNRMNSEGTKILDDGTMIFDGRPHQPTIEGPKLYKRNGYFYIFAPAGGVKPGWQTVLRSRNIYGPYEAKIVLHQGGTNVNGPHQGAWVQTPSGESWFIHFQDRGVYGRIEYLEPVKWVDDWPLVGGHPDENGTGEPVARFRKPSTGHASSISVPQTDDEFNQPGLGLQWQWESNPGQGWYSLQARKGWLRLYSQEPSDHEQNLWNLGSILGAKIPASEFSVTTRLVFDSLSDSDRTGLIILGADYCYVGIRKRNGACSVIQVVCINANGGGDEQECTAVAMNGKEIYLRVSMRKQAVCTFSYSLDGETYKMFGREFNAKPGMWVGARIGLFAKNGGGAGHGFADYDWIRFQRAN